MASPRSTRLAQFFTRAAQTAGGLAFQILDIKSLRDFQRMLEAFKSMIQKRWGFSRLRRPLVSPMMAADRSE
jgi:hypothetical protein